LIKVMKKPSSPAVGSVSIQSLEQRGREQLRQARFKDAVETFKKLVKQDKQPLWKKLLNQAYVGYARHLAVKGMAKEAQITLENTASAGGLVQDPALYFSCLVLQHQYQKAAAFYRRISTSPAGASLDASQGTSLGASLAEAVCVLDLVAAAASFAAPRAEARIEADVSVSGAAAPARALAAWCAGCPTDELDRWLQTISLRSPAGSLRVILKALLLTDAEKRAGFLQSIPSSSVFAGFARAAAAASGATGQWAVALEALTAAERRCAAEIQGSHPATAQLLLDFETAERRGPGVLLSWLLANADRFQKAALRAACLDLLPHAPDLLPRVEAKCGSLSLAEKYRIMAMNAEGWDASGRSPCGSTDRNGSAIPYWKKAAEAFAAEEGAVAKLSAALIYRHMAAPHGKTDASLYVGRKQNSARIQYLERSLELDPDDPDSVLALLKLLEHEGRSQAWANRIEWALPRFPDHVAILEAAIEAATRRHAWQQALVHVRKLLTIDPINQQARQRMIEICMAQARAQMRANRPDLAWQDLQQAAAWDRSDQPDQALAISRALVEWRTGSGQGSDPDHAVAGLHAIVAKAGNRGAVAVWFQILLEAWLMGFDDTACEPLIHHLQTAMHTPPLSKDDVILTIEQLGSRNLHDHETLLPKALDLIEPWLIANLTDNWLIDEFQFDHQRNIEFRSLSVGSADRNQQIAETLQQAGAFRALACYARQGRTQHPHEPTYRFYEILAEIRGNSRQPGAGDIDILEDLSRQAVDQENFSLLNRIMKLMRELLPGQGLPQDSPQGLPSHFDFDDDDDDDDDDDWDDDTVGFDAPLAAILDAIGASRKKLLAMAKTSGIDATLDYLIKLLTRASGRRPLPLPKSVLKEVLRSMLAMELLEG
jgi:tetratricopeptide (TPR) repeat protein